MEPKMPEENIRRRRSRGLVTQNACTECRRRRAKCDGKKPCSSCTARNGVQCQYEMPARVSKENMRKETEHLQGRLHVRDTVIAALLLNESSNMVLQQLREKVPLQEIAEQIYMSCPSLRGQPPPSRGDPIYSEIDYGSYEARVSEHWRLQPSDGGNSVQPLKSAGYIPHSRKYIEEERFGHAIEVVDTQWTEVSSDKAMIEHSFALYFCWEHPIFQTFSQEHFLSDFRTGTERYCSNFLVNALLALGCRLSVQQDSQSGPGAELTAASRFFAEAKRLLAIKKSPLLPAVQTLGLMSLYEASCGHDSESWFFSCQSMQMAIEMGLHTEIPIRDEITAIEQEVRTITFWGAFSLHQIWSLTLGRLPCISKDIPRVAKCSLIKSIEDSPWIPYRDESFTQGRNFEEPSYPRTVHRCLCELSEIIHDSLYDLYTPGENMSSTRLLGIYRQYLAWKSSLPEPCHLGATPIPAVLHLHIYYHFALVMLFRPFIKFRFVNSAISPVEVCLEAANNISSLVQTYRQKYSFNQTPIFVPCMLLASSIARLTAARSLPAAIGEPPLAFRELAELQLLSARYPFSRRAISIIHFLARQWGIDIYFAGQANHTGGQDNLCLPIPGTMNFFCPNIEALGTSSQERIDMALFSPFKMQGLPLISSSLAGMERIGLQLLK